MHMKVVETLLLGEKHYVRFWDLQFGLEGSGEGWNGQVPGSGVNSVEFSQRR
jgi:hypothetical protein